jgi:hypothetical protein
MVFLVASFVHINQADAAEDKTPMFRPCTNADFPGIWRMMRVEEKPIGAETVIFRDNTPFQYVQFSVNGRYLFMQTNVEIQDGKELLKSIADATNDLGLSYTTDDKGTLIIKNAEKITDQHSCYIALKTSGIFVKNNLVLSQGTKNPTPTSTTRIYRKIFATK